LTNSFAALRSHFTRVSWAWLFIAFAAMLAVLPLMLHGCSCGHDFDFHLQNWLEASGQWKAGIFKPVWDFSAAWKAGEPRLLFYPPISWMTGGLLTLLLPFKAVPVAFTWLSLFLSGLTMRRLLRPDMGDMAATLGGCIYLANPYMLFVAYERTAYGELLAAAWMPLLFAALLRPHASTRAALWRVAVPVALLWLTNAPAAVVGSYSMLAMGVVRMVQLRWGHRRMMVRYALTMATGYALGLLAASIYLVPAVYQRESVQSAMAVIEGLRPWESFLFQHTADAGHDRVLAQASRIAVRMLLSAALTAVVVWLRMRTEEKALFAAMTPRERRERRQVSAYAVLLPMAVFTAMVLLLLLPVSRHVWMRAPELVFLQFPWRFLVAESVAACVLLMLALRPDRWTRVRRAVPLAAGLVLIALSTMTGEHFYRQVCEAGDTPKGLIAATTSRDGTPPTDEYTPTIADNDALGHPTPDAWLGASAEAPPGVILDRVEVTHRAPDDFRITTPQRQGSFLIVRLRKYRGWHVVKDGVELEGTPQRADGLYAIPLLTMGPHEVAVHYRKTADQWIGGAMSAFGWFVLLCMAAFGWWMKRSLRED